MSQKNVRNLLLAGSKNANAITAPNRPALTYEALIEHIDQIGSELAGQGLTNADRVAIVLPNGPEMATAFLAVSSLQLRTATSQRPSRAGASAYDWPHLT